MVYCMSDIHGEIDRYHEMLKLIHFTRKDTLYIIGDVIDRMPGGIDLLKEIMATPNIAMLLGNHEQMCLNTLGPYNVLGSRALWQQNGGSNTYNELRDLCTKEERQKIIDFLLSLPDHKEIEVNERRFYLVHAYPSDEPEKRIWERPDPEAAAPMENCTVIIGHTPTCYMTGNREEPFRIWHGEGIIDIDWGCGQRTEMRSLGCLRLDDMSEFYV